MKSNQKYMMRQRFLIRYFAIAFAFNLFTVIAAATDFTQQARLSSGVAGQSYANIGVGISGNTAVVASEAGYYVYIRSGTTWSQQTILIPSDGMAGCGFPQRVAIDGNTIVVGCTSVTIGGNASQGAAYVFYRDGANWSEQQRLTASDGAATDRFGGRSVAIKGDTVVIGATGNDIGANTDQGSAYVFQRNGSVWTEQAILTADNPAAFNYFGQFISMDTNVLAVSNGPQPGAGSNAVYVFVRSGNTWTFQQRLSNCEPSGTDGYCPFGGSTAIQGDRLLVGNTSLNVGSNQFQGGVYFYSRSGSIWTQQQRLTAADGLANDLFGSSLAVNGDTLIVGAQADIGFPGKVDVYNFEASQWVFHRRLTSGFGMRDAFGQNLAFDGSSLIVAAPREGSGAAYIFARPIINLIRSPFDFDGDSKTDLSIFRPNGASSEWWWLKSGSGGNAAVVFGANTDTIVPADYTGDGKTDIAFWRPSTGQWFVLRSEDLSFFAFPFGTSGDTPVPADFDGDGKADAAVFRESSLTWFISKSSGGTDILTFGAAGDKPVPGDFDGDGKADLAVFRPAGATGTEWWVRRSSNGSSFALQFGTATDKGVPGDYTGDGKTDIAFWRPSNGNWFVLRSEDFSFFAFPFGANGDTPVPGDYDGDGKWDAGVFRPSNSTWFVQRSTAGTLIQQFGIAGDLPLPNAFVP